MIGISVPSVAMKQEIRYACRTDSLVNMYKPLAKRYQMDFCMFSFRQIRQDLRMVEALVYSCKQEKLVREVVTVPQVNIVRNTRYVVNRGLIKKFEKLCQENIRFINFPLYRQANKLQNCKYLNSFDLFKKHIPPTKRLSLENLNSFIGQYGKAIIKPIYGSKGRGITIVEKDDATLRVCRTPLNANSKSALNSSKNTISLPHGQLRSFYKETFPRPSSFLVQQCIPLEEFKGLPFDLRAVMQKNGKNRWQVTSRVARVAKEQGYVTNLSQGGEMVSLSNLQLNINQGEVGRFCLKLAKAFEKIYPWTAEMGIDLALDKDGKLWYIETNFCPEKVRWATIFKIPFEYAYSMYTRL